MNKPAFKTLRSDPRRLLLEALDTRWKNYLAEISRCRVEFTDEAVHDLRVATRRILALIQLLDSILPGPNLEKLPRAFKRQLDEFDDLRDTQVILAELSKTLPQFPQLQDFQDHLLSVEERMLRVLHKKLKQRDTSEIARGILKTSESITAEVKDDLESRILQAVDDAYLLTRMRLGWVDISQPATIHRVRVAFKAFRYMVEIVHPLLHGFPPRILKRMNTYQTLMGEIQDAEVFASTLDDFSGNTPRPDLGPVRCYYEERLTKAITAFAGIDEPTPHFLAPRAGSSLPLGESMMKIYLIRHSNAVDAGTPGYKDDSTRPLTEKGRAKMRRIASALRKLGLKPDLIVSSPYVRAHETAEILAKMVKYGKGLVFSDALVPMGNPEDIIAEITEKLPVDELVLVGHEPCLSTLMGALIAGNSDSAISLKKGGVGCLSTDNLRGSRSAVLEWLLTPKILSRLS